MGYPKITYHKIHKQVLTSRIQLTSVALLVFGKHKQEIPHWTAPCMDWNSSRTVNRCSAVLYLHTLCQNDNILPCRQTSKKNPSRISWVRRQNFFGPVVQEFMNQWSFKYTFSCSWIQITIVCRLITFINIHSCCIQLMSAARSERFMSL